MSSLDDLDSGLNPILPISQKKIVAKIEDIWTDIYQASLQAEALQNANRSKTKAHLFESSFAEYQLFYDFFANNT